MDTNKTNGWVEYKERVLYQLTELGRKQDEFNKKLDRLIVDVTVLKTKAGIYGAIGGFIVTIIVQLMFLLLTHGKA